MRNKSRKKMSGPTLHVYDLEPITDPAELIAQLEMVRVRGYSTDEGEQEVGVRCVAVPVLGAPIHLAMSISGPTARMGDQVLVDARESLRSAARSLAAYLNS